VVLADDAVDAVIVIYTDPMVTEPHDIAAAVRRVVEDGTTKPVAATFLSTKLGPVIEVTDVDGNRRDIPLFRFPESPAVALGRVAWLAGWRQRPAGTTPVLDRLDPEAARQLVTRILTRRPEGAWLEPDDLAALLSAFGVDMVPHAVVSSAADAGAAAEGFGRPLALKVVSSTIQHKSDVGGVALGVAPGDAAAVYDGLRERLGDAMEGVILQPMVDPGVEVIIGVVNDPLFGPAIMFGMGGTATELFADRAFRIVPITDVDATALVRAPRSSALLDGYRGSEAVDRGALEDVVLRLGRMAETIPELAELDFNPVIARPDGAFIVDARARIAPVSGPPARAVRHLDRPARIT
jgi:acyl-CoA synthetase (NDP forming)